MRSVSPYLLSLASFLLCVPCARPQQLILRLVGEESGDRFGFGLDNAGDLDGDGASDLIVGAPYAGLPGTDHGKALVYSSGSGTVLHEWLGEANGDYFGSAVAGGGDLNGDGINDLGVGAPNNSAGAHFAGSAHVYSGATGLQLLAFHYDVARSYFGKSIDIGGDLDADGCNDILVGAYNHSKNSRYLGAVFAYSGKTGALLHVLNGDISGCHFGWSVAFVDDTNQDGVDDFLVGARNHSGAGQSAGRAYLYSGRDAGLIAQFDGSSTQYRAMGSAVASAGDVTGDGLEDLLIGAEGTYYDTYQKPGRVFVYSGRTRALVYRIDGTLAMDGFGASVAGVGDLNQDGVDDVLVGAPSYGLDYYSGRAAVFSGTDGSLFFEFLGTDFAEGLGFSVSGPGDVDGDGLRDFAFGAFGGQAAGGFPAGRVEVYSGRAAPRLFSVAPARGRYDQTSRVSLTGELFTYFEPDQSAEVFFGASPAQDVVVVDDTRIDCEAPPGDAGPSVITVRNSMGEASLGSGFHYTPATLVSSPVAPGEIAEILFLCDPSDFLLGIYGGTEGDPVSTPPFDGGLCIHPFTVLFLIPNWPFDELLVVGTVPADPSLSGVDLPVQALVGPADQTSDKGTSWTNCGVLHIE